MDQREKKIQVLKKSFWRFPTEAKVALGTNISPNDYFSASQFVVNNGSTLEIQLCDANLEIWIDGKKEIGISKYYPLEKSGRGKYIKKALLVANAALSVADIITNLVA